MLEVLPWILFPSAPVKLCINWQGNTAPKGDESMLQGERDIDATYITSDF